MTIREAVASATIGFVGGAIAYWLWLIRPIKVTFIRRVPPR